jgi:hypothetical protein
VMHHEPAKLHRCCGRMVWVDHQLRLTVEVQ